MTTCFLACSIGSSPALLATYSIETLQHLLPWTLLIWQKDCRCRCSAYGCQNRRCQPFLGNNHTSRRPRYYNRQHAQQLVKNFYTSIHWESNLLRSQDINHGPIHEFDASCIFRPSGLPLAQRSIALLHGESRTIPNQNFPRTPECLLRILHI